MTKEELRQTIRARLAKLKDAPTKSVEACEFLLSLKEMQEARTLLLYVSKEGELSTHQLIQWLLVQSDRRVCVPAYEEKRQRYFASELKNFARDLEVGKFGILEPRAEAERPVPWDEISAVIVPGLAFDKQGNRLGRGGGHFDAMLPQIRGVKIGLAFDCQIVDSLPMEEHDVPVDIVVTEERAIYTRQKDE